MFYLSRQEIHDLQVQRMMIDNCILVYNILHPQVENVVMSWILEEGNVILERRYDMLTITLGDLLESGGDL